MPASALPKPIAAAIEGIFTEEAVRFERPRADGNEGMARLAMPGTRTGSNQAQASIFSVDVEDWFHILGLDSTPDVGDWARLPGIVERDFPRMLDLFDENGVRVTCFFLGWVAEKYPHLVREAARRGHEISSHGYSHRLTYTLSPAAFYDDVRRTKDLLEGITGQGVDGYRCPSFSVTDDTPWFFDKLIEAGYSYDSSLFPASRQNGGLRNGRLEPHVVRGATGSILEFPVSIARLFGMRVCFFGGGYLRLSPYSLMRRMGNQVLKEGRPIVFYVHPREIDPNHPRLAMGLGRRFRSYVGLRTTEPKMRRIFRDFPVTTFRDYIARHSPGASSS